MRNGESSMKNAELNISKIIRFNKKYKMNTRGIIQSYNKNKFSHIKLTDTFPF